MLNQDTTFKVDDIDILQKFRKFQEMTPQTPYSVAQDNILDLSPGSLFSRQLSLDEFSQSSRNESIDPEERWPNLDKRLCAVSGDMGKPETFAKAQENARTLNMSDPLSEYIHQIIYH
ncbi:hypothetical protein BGX27_002022 [Mortierella sp. AM989]|nr:hypothetical protein BGX27_002022 [Mortierella sp. AM989]